MFHISMTEFPSICINFATLANAAHLGLNAATVYYLT